MISVDVASILAINDSGTNFPNGLHKGLNDFGKANGVETLIKKP